MFISFLRLFFRYLVFVPLVGGCLKSLLFFLVIYLELDVNYLFLAYAVDGFSGSFYALLLGLSASIADVTTSSRQRVLFFAVLEIILAVAGGVSQVMREKWGRGEGREESS